MRERYTREQHVALDELLRIRTARVEVAVDQAPAIAQARAAGLSLAEIGEALGVSRQAVHYHTQGGKGK